MNVIEIKGARYYVDEVGKKYRSVTGILSETKPDRDKLALENWQKKVGKFEAKKIFLDACKRGTFTHACAESFLKNEPVELDYELGIPYWESLKPALRPIKDVIAMEVAISHPLGYAGRFDCFGEYRGVPNTIVDFKTSDKPKKREYVNDYCLQLAAYAGGIKHTLGESVNQGVIIIGIKDRVAQTFILSREDLLFYWKIWEKRVQKYHFLNIDTEYAISS